MDGDLTAGASFGQNCATAELANRIPFLLGSPPSPTNREPRCALRSEIPRGPSTPRLTGWRPGTPSPRAAGPPRSRARPGAPRRPRGSRRDDARRGGPGRRRGGRRRGRAAGPPLPHAATDPRHPPPPAAAGRPRPGGVGRGPPAAGPRTGDGPRRVPGRPGRSHSGWLISKEMGPAPRRSVAGVPCGPAPAGAAVGGSSLDPVDHGTHLSSRGTERGGCPARDRRPLVKVWDHCDGRNGVGGAAACRQRRRPHAGGHFQRTDTCQPTPR